MQCCRSLLHTLIPRQHGSIPIDQSLVNPMNQCNLGTISCTILNVKCISLNSKWISLHFIFAGTRPVVNNPKPTARAYLTNHIHLNTNTNHGHFLLSSCFPSHQPYKLLKPLYYLNTHNTWYILTCCPL